MSVRVWRMGQDQYFHSQFPDIIAALELNINSLELLAIVVSVKLWGARWKGKRIRILCDNMTSVCVLNSGAAKDSFLQACLREICYLAAIHEFEIRARHLAGVENRVADLCSRLHLSDSYKRLFHESNKTWQLQPQTVPTKFFEFCHPW